MRQSYLDYAMSVIVQRALPDARDGFKPVHRRVLYAMSEMGMRSNTRYRKSAGIVGEVLKNYHPHSDAAVYDTLVRMAQPFNLRYPLIDGQGNFGSVDGDGAAAMRYTESRLAAIADEMLVDIDKRHGRFQAELRRRRCRSRTCFPPACPTCCSTAAPASRSAWRRISRRTISTKSATRSRYLIDNPEATVDELMEIVQGPDFPTGGTILGREGIRAAYATGRGRVVIRAKAFVEESRAATVPDRRHRAPLSGQQGRPARAHRRAGQRRQARRHQRPARRVRPHRHAHGHRAQARRPADEGAEQPLQAHRAAADLRRQHAGPGRARARSRAS